MNDQSRRTKRHLTVCSINQDKDNTRGASGLLILFTPKQCGMLKNLHAGSSDTDCSMNILLTEIDQSYVGTRHCFWSTLWVILFSLKKVNIDWKNCITYQS